MMGNKDEEKPSSQWDSNSRPLNHAAGAQLLCYSRLPLITWSYQSWAERKIFIQPYEDKIILVLKMWWFESKVWMILENFLSIQFLFFKTFKNQKEFWQSWRNSETMLGWWKLLNVIWVRKWLKVIVKKIVQLLITVIGLPSFFSFFTEFESGRERKK